MPFQLVSDSVSDVTIGTRMKMVRMAVGMPTIRPSVILSFRDRAAERLERTTIHVMPSTMSAVNTSAEIVTTSFGGTIRKASSR